MLDQLAIDGNSKRRAAVEEMQELIEGWRERSLPGTSSPYKARETDAMKLRSGPLSPSAPINLGGGEGVMTSNSASRLRKRSRPAHPPQFGDSDSEHDGQDDNHGAAGDGAADLMHQTKAVHPAAAAGLGAVGCAADSTESSDDANEDDDDDDVVVVPRGRRQAPKPSSSGARAGAVARVIDLSDDDGEGGGGSHLIDLTGNQHDGHDGSGSSQMRANGAGGAVGGAAGRRRAKRKAALAQELSIDDSETHQVCLDHEVVLKQLAVRGLLPQSVLDALGIASSCRSGAVTNGSQSRSGRRQRAPAGSANARFFVGSSQYLTVNGDVVAALAAAAEAARTDVAIPPRQYNRGASYGAAKLVDSSMSRSPSANDDDDDSDVRPRRRSGRGGGLRGAYRSVRITRRSTGNGANARRQEQGFNSSHADGSGSRRSRGNRRVIDDDEENQEDEHDVAGRDRDSASDSDHSCRVGAARARGASDARQQAAAAASGDGTELQRLRLNGETLVMLRNKVRDVVFLMEHHHQTQQRKGDSAAGSAAAAAIDPASLSSSSQSSSGGLALASSSASHARSGRPDKPPSSSSDAAPGFDANDRGDDDDEAAAGSDDDQAYDDEDDDADENGNLKGFIATSDDDEESSEDDEEYSDNDEEGAEDVGGDEVEAAAGDSGGDEAEDDISDAAGAIKRLRDLVTRLDAAISANEARVKRACSGSIDSDSDGDDDVELISCASGTGAGAGGANNAHPSRTSAHLSGNNAAGAAAGSSSGKAHVVVDDDSMFGSEQSDDAALNSPRGQRGRSDAGSAAAGAARADGAGHAVSKGASAFAGSAPSTPVRDGAQPTPASVAAGQGSNLMGFGMFCNKRTWAWVLQHEASYCAYVINEEHPGCIGFRDFRDWLRSLKLASPYGKLS